MSVVVAEWISRGRRWERWERWVVRWAMRAGKSSLWEDWRSGMGGIVGWERADTVVEVVLVRRVWRDWRWVVRKGRMEGSRVWNCWREEVRRSWAEAVSVGEKAM